jgi:hypothetical protein
VLLTRLPLGVAPSFDLHVLGTPPALILSQDQTLHKISCPAPCGSGKAYRRATLALQLLTKQARSPELTADHPRAIGGRSSTVGCVVPGTGGAGSWDAPTKNLSSGTTKNAALAASPAPPSGDPQTYALLCCSVFKGQTPAPGPLRAGSLTAPNRRGARVTTAILSPAARAVKAKGGRFLIIILVLIWELGCGAP